MGPLTELRLEVGGNNIKKRNVMVEHKNNRAATNRYNTLEFPGKNKENMFCSTTFDINIKMSVRGKSFF